MTADALGTKETEKRSPLAALADAGAAGQAVVPGVYAWAVTVVPAAWSRPSNVGVKIAAVLALFALLQTLFGSSLEGVDARGASSPRSKGAPRRDRAGAVGVWVFVLASTVVWFSVPTALAPAHLHPSRAIAGMLGWGVFAFAVAAPALGPSRTGPLPEGGLKPRLPLARADAVYIAIAVVMAIALQALGWSVLVPERAVLVRLVPLAAGIAIIAAATSIATARHGTSPGFARAFRSALPMLACIALLI